MTRAILKADDKVSYVSTRETDARTALTRGLAEYMKEQSIITTDGRPLQFKNTFETWAEPENEADYPSLACYTETPGRYDKSRFTPSVSKDARLPDGRYIASGAELVIEVKAEVWATDPAERMWLLAMMEDALNPSLFMHGLRLEMPHYFNQRADFELVTINYDDGELTSMQRYRKAVIILNACIPVTFAVTLPGARPSARVGVDTAT